MELRTGYKKTELGLIPDNWDICVLRDCCTKITDGTHDTPKPTRSGTPFLTAIHVKENNIDFEGCLYLPNEVHAAIYRRCNPERNDVLMVNIGAGVATTALVNVDYEFSLKNVALLKPAKEILSGVFLNHSLSAQKSRTTQTLLNGGAQPFLGLGQIGDLQIPLPPISEQSAIANALSDADALIQSLQNLIEKKRQIKQGATHDLLSGKTRLPNFGTDGDLKESVLGKIPKDWNVKLLPEVIDFFHGKAHEQFISEIGNYEVVNSKFVSTEGGIKKYSNVNFCPARVGDNLMVLSDLPNGKALAKCFYVERNEKYAVNQRVCIFRSKEADSKFLYYILNRNSYFLSLDDGVTQTHILNNDIENCPLLIPQQKKEQTAIATILSDMDAEIATLESKLTKYQQIKQGMMQNLLTGRIRLV